MIPGHTLHFHRVNRLPRFITICGVFLLLAISTLACRADDIGLISAKLTETAPNSYILETDIPPQLRNVVGIPVLPVGFQTQPTEFEQRGSLINVRYPFTGDVALGPTDAILLPWSRTGVLVNARWLDGSRGSHLFLSTVEGITVEIDKLRTVKTSRRDTIRAGLTQGFDSASRNWMLWLPVLCIGLLFPAAQATRLVAMLIAGLIAALLLLDIHTIAVPANLALSMMMVAVVLAAGRPNTRLLPVFATAGCFIGLGLASASEFPTEPRIAFIVGSTMFFLGVSALLIAVRHFLPFKLPSHAIGGLAVAAILINLPNDSTTAEEKLLSAAPMPTVSNSKIAKTAGKLESPFTAFVVIEPYEIRFEIMASGEAITRLLEFPLSSPDTIAVEEQAVLKAEAIAELAARFSLNIDGQTALPETKRADFLTLGAAGAFTRTEALEEPLKPAILGFTFTYPLAAPPKSLALAWSRLPIPDGNMPATILEPSGTTGFSFSPTQLALEWENQSDDLRPSTITAVEVQRSTWAPLSILLLLAGLAFTAKAKSAASYTCLGLALLSTPFIRTPLPLSSPLPSDQAHEVAGHLLTNIYRSFDFRQESTIYDQLAVSITGDQLTNIYLDQRRALELENRGGARARVENVDVETIESISPNGNGVDLHARWNVSGSVNHFGHTHYRQNAYDAILRLKPVDGVWKISAIDVNEEKRIY